jgi:DNA uptake protein ComE-like DNA-binding protein
MSEISRNVDLNSASEDELEHVAGLGKEKSKRLVEERPIRSWDDLKNIEGFDDKLVEDLRQAGATLGEGYAGDKAA